MGAFPTDAALLGAAEWGGRIGHQAAIEPNDAVIDLFRYAHATAQVPGVKIRDEAVFGVVCPPDHFVFGLECLDCRYRPENLLVQHGSSVRHRSKDSGRI